MKSKVILLAIAFAIVAPFSAANAVGNNVQTTTDTATVNEEDALKQAPNNTVTREPEVPGSRIEQAREAARAKVEHVQAEAKARKLALKQDRCETHRAKLTTQLPHLSQSVASIKKELDAKYVKVTDIYNSGKLTVSNFAALDAEIKAKQSAAQAAIDSVSATKVTIDCNNSGLGVQLDSYRATVTLAKTALKEYRTSLVNLASALNAAADKAEADTSKATNTTTGGAN